LEFKIRFRFTLLKKQPISKILEFRLSVESKAPHPSPLPEGEGTDWGLLWIFFDQKVVRWIPKTTRSISSLRERELIGGCCGSFSARKSFAKSQRQRGQFPLYVRGNWLGVAVDLFRPESCSLNPKDNAVNSLSTWEGIDWGLLWIFSARKSFTESQRQRGQSPLPPGEG